VLWHLYSPRRHEGHEEKRKDVYLQFTQMGMYSQRVSGKQIGALLNTGLAEAWKKRRPPPA
jgi:hypothetical protein